jgi:Transposase IS116/IS110/IS902 family
MPGWPPPDSWHSIGTRSSPYHLAGNRSTAHPVNAIRNYAYAALESEIRMTAVAAIDADMRRMTRASSRRRLMTIPGVGQLTAPAFVAAIDDPSRIRRSRDVGAYLGLVSRKSRMVEMSSSR